MGGKGGGIARPREITPAWVNEQLALPDEAHQARVRQLIYAAPTQDFADEFGADGASVAVVNWNDDGLADVMIVRQAPAPGTPAGYVLSGRALWDDPVSAAGSTATGAPTSWP